jgi:hypothetical protein
LCKSHIIYNIWDATTDIAHIVDATKNSAISRSSSFRINVFNWLMILMKTNGCCQWRFVLHRHHCNCSFGFYNQACRRCLDTRYWYLLPQLYQIQNRHSRHNLRFHLFRIHLPLFLAKAIFIHFFQQTFECFVGNWINFISWICWG